MIKATGNDGFFSRSLNKQNLLLILSMLTLALSYVAAVSSSHLRGGWSVKCCGRAFWSISAALVLVGAALLFRVRRQWSWISAALLSIYVSYHFSYEAVESWSNYYSLDKMQAFREAFLLPLFRPLSGFLALYILVVALRNLLRTPRHRSLPDD